MSAPTPLTSPIVTGQVQLAVGPPTYSAGAIWNVADGASDFLTIANGGTRTIQIISIYLEMTGAPGANPAIYLIKRSVVDTGGTFTLRVNVPYDSTNPTSQAVIRTYTVNPTVLGAAVGNADIQTITVAAAVVGTVPGKLLFQVPGQGQSQFWTVRGTEQLCVSNNLYSGGVLATTGRVIWAEL